MPGDLLHYSALLTTLLVAAGMYHQSAALQHFAAGDDNLVTLLRPLRHCTAAAATCLCSCRLYSRRRCQKPSCAA